MDEDPDLQTHLMHWRHALDQLQREVTEGPTSTPLGRAKRLAAQALEVQYRLGELSVELGSEVDSLSNRASSPALAELVHLLQAQTITRLTMNHGAELAQSLQRLVNERAASE